MTDSDYLSENPAAHDRLRRLIDQALISIVFQPIVDLQHGDVIGYEALTRPDRQSGFRHAGELYASAHSCGLVSELEHLARVKTFEAMQADGRSTTLFLNISPQVMTDEHFVDCLRDELTAAPHLTPNQVVLELTERDDFGDIGPLSVQTFVLREQGYQLAIDDVGAGTSGLNRIMSLRPHWLKLDRELVQNIDADPFKHNMIRFLAQFSHISRIRLIGEGIERRQELRSLIDLGIDGGQGYYLACPGPLDQPVNHLLSKEIVELHQASTKRRFNDVRSTGICDEVEPAHICSTTTSVADAKHTLGHSANGAGVIVIDDTRYVGWLPASTLNEADDSTPIGTLALRRSSPLEAMMSVREAIAFVASSPDDALPNPLIVVDHGRPLGIIALRKLLTIAAAASEDGHAHLTALTGLPDRAQADRWIAQAIREGASFHAAFIDLCDFDAYNGAYGVEMGDAMIRRLVALIRAIVPLKDQTQQALLAHLGGDQFLLVGSFNLQATLHEINDGFIAVRPELFSPVDIAADAFRVLDRREHQRVCALTGLRMIAIPDASTLITSPRELHQLAQRLRATGTVMTLDGGVLILADEADEEPLDRRLRITA